MTDKAHYKVTVIKGDNCTGIGIEKFLPEGYEHITKATGHYALRLASIYVDNEISYREGYRRAVRFINEWEDKDVVLVISVPKNFLNGDIEYMLKNCAPLRDCRFRGLPKELHMTLDLLAFDAINRGTTITEVLYEG